MRINIHWKLMVVLFGTISVILVGTYAYLQSHLKTYFIRQFEETLRKEIFLNKNLIETMRESEFGQKQADIVADTIGRNLTVRATIISTDGTVMGDSGLDNEHVRSAENHLERPEVQDAFKKGFGQSERYSRTLKKRMLYMAVPLVVKEKEIPWIVRVAVPVSEVLGLENKLRRIIAVAVCLAFLFSAVLSLAVAFYISRPLSEMAAVARNMAKGDFSKKVYISSKDEVGDLAAALNHMSDGIKEMIRKVTGEEAKFEAILASMLAGVMVTDEKGRIVIMNPSLRKLFMIDVAPEGKLPIEVIRNAAVQDIATKALQGVRALASDELQLNVPQERFIQVNGAPIVREGRCAGAIIVFHDITELKRLERIRKDFVANVSHELRTPIASIKGYAETLLDGALQDKEHSKEFVRIMYENSDRLAKLIEDLLDLSKIESGKMKIAFLPVDIAGAYARAAAVIANQAQQKSISLQNKIPAGMPKVMADETRLSQVLVNLLDNAVKYTPEKGTVTVTASVKDRFVQVDITDTGAGIPPNDLSRIFERFYRVDKAHSRELGGTGLGLSIVKHIVQIHGGNVRVESEPGVGSTFSFTIPTE